MIQITSQQLWKIQRTFESLMDTYIYIYDAKKPRITAGNSNSSSCKRSSSKCFNRTTPFITFFLIILIMSGQDIVVDICASTIF
jgi:hypothetical protein